MFLAFGIALGGALGSLGRYYVSLLMKAGPGLSVSSTTTVNLIGCLGIGVFASLAPRFPAYGNFFSILMIGFLGGFTTFSAFGLEVFRALERLEWGQIVAIILLNVLGGVAAVALGYWLTSLSLSSPQ